MPEVPVIPAATVLLLANRPHLEVALLTRRKASAFVGGMTVFPGGGVDDHDRDPSWEEDDFDAGSKLPLPHALSYWIAAIRETWEEADIFLGTPQPNADLRAQVDTDQLSFQSAVRATGSILEYNRLVPIGRWITPEGSPRRYDTIFFVAHVAHDEQLVVDGREAVDAAWSSADLALAALRDGSRILLPPTSVTLEIIATYTDAREVITAARNAEPLADQHRLRRVGGDPYSTYFLPGEQTPEAARPAEGWVSLPPRDNKAKDHA